MICKFIKWVFDVVPSYVVNFPLPDRPDRVRLHEAYKVLDSFYGYAAKIVKTHSPNPTFKEIVKVQRELAELYDIFIDQEEESEKRYDEPLNH